MVNILVAVIPTIASIAAFNIALIKDLEHIDDILADIDFIGDPFNAESLDSSSVQAGDSAAIKSNHFKIIGAKTMQIFAHKDIEAFFIKGRTKYVILHLEDIEEGGLPILTELESTINRYYDFVHDNTPLEVGQTYQSNDIIPAEQMVVQSVDGRKVMIYCDGYWMFGEDYVKDLDFIESAWTVIALGTKI